MSIVKIPLFDSELPVFNSFTLAFPAHPPKSATVIVNDQWMNACGFAWIYSAFWWGLPHQSRSNRTANAAVVYWY